LLDQLGPPSLGSMVHHNDEPTFLTTKNPPSPYVSVTHLIKGFLPRKTLFPPHTSSLLPLLQLSDFFPLIMTTTFTFERIPAPSITPSLLAESASLFSSSYGIWGPLAPSKLGNHFKPGKRIKMSPSRLREQVLPPGTDSILVRGLAGSSLAGYACATRWEHEGRRICWVTQLCVAPEYRGQKLATRILRELREGVGERGDLGILSSHPAAIMAALSAWGRGVEEVDLGVVKERAKGVMAASPVGYVREAVLKGTLFGQDEAEGVCCADTGFWVDHGEPMAALAAVKERGVAWPFGHLPDGCEFLVLVERAGGEE
jgi:GNAT superfamily N-acetyltransferase